MRPAQTDRDSQQVILYKPSQTGTVFQAASFLSQGTSHLDHQDSACRSSSTNLPALFSAYADIVRNHHVLNLLSLGPESGHGLTKVHDISSIVFHYHKSALGVLWQSMFQTSRHLIGIWRGKNRACDSSRQHAFTDKAGPGGFVPGTATTDQGDIL